MSRSSPGPIDRKSTCTRARQGFWVARLAATLGADVVLCCALGGGPGRVLRGPIEAEHPTLAGARRLHQAGGDYVLVSRGPAPAILIDGASGPAEIDLVGPTFEALDHHGTGDSMFAATGVGLARGMTMIDALRLGVAAGALNATRCGLGTRTREEIEPLAGHVPSGPVVTDVGRRVRR